MTYADIEYYVNDYGGDIPADLVKKYLRLASEKIDTVTFNRIQHIGFDKLTPFQQENVRKSACIQADFFFEQGIEPMGAQSYSVLDISVSVGDSKSPGSSNGMSNHALELLKQTGLCWRVM